MPLVSVLLAVRNDERFVAEAVQSVVRQTLRDFELIVVDDASTDGTPAILAGIDDDRLSIVRNEERLGLAASLNRGLEHAKGRYVARLDSDDVALPNRLERQVAGIGSRLAVGTAVRDLDEQGVVGKLHRNPLGPRGVRWLALFSSPFFHPTVLVDREQLNRHGLRYDEAFEESEDYDLWARLLEHGDGANLPDALVLKRVHAAQASQRRGHVQESFQRKVALRQIARTTADVDAERAWRVGARKRGGSRREFLRLLRAFERQHGRDRAVRSAAARALLSPRRRA